MLTTTKRIKVSLFLVTSLFFLFIGLSKTSAYVEELCNWYLHPGYPYTTCDTTNKVPSNHYVKEIHTWFYTHYITGGGFVYASASVSGGSSNGAFWYPGTPGFPLGISASCYSQDCSYGHGYSSVGPPWNAAGWLVVYAVIEPKTIPGCTDPSAQNYNPNATQDDGSCVYYTYPYPTPVPPPYPYQYQYQTPYPAPYPAPYPTPYPTPYTYPTPVAFNYSLSNSGPLTINKLSNEDVTLPNTVTKTLVSGSTQSVDVDISGVPSGVSYGFSNRQCSPTCTTTIFFTVSPSAPAGTYPITVTGTPLNRTTVFNLVISNPPMSVTCTVEPTSAQLNQTLVTWTATVEGGTPPYTYSWSGLGIKTNPAPSTNPLTLKYSTIGNKSAIATVTDSSEPALQAACPAGPLVNVWFYPLFEEF